jgi:5-hydroxyisourate hydrolase
MSPYSTDVGSRVSWTSGKEHGRDHERTVVRSCSPLRETQAELPAGVVRIVTQVVDGAYGKSAAGLRVCLSSATGNAWSTVAEAETDGDGCIKDWNSRHLERGLYRIVFDSDGYFARLGAASAYPEIVVMFRMEDEACLFRVNVTLSPYSYSTYFGTAESYSGES